MRASQRKSEPESNIDVEPWVKEELSAIERENRKKRVAKIRELNLMKIEQKGELEVLKQKGELQKLKREMKISDPAGADAFAKSLATNPAMQKQWLSWTDQQRAIIMAGMQQSKAQGTDSDLTKYMLIAQMQNKPSTTLKDVLEVVQVLSKNKGEGNEGKNMIEAIRLGFEMSMKSRPQDTSPGTVFKETMTLLKPFYDSLSKKDKELYNQQFETIRSQIQPLSQQLKEHSEIAHLMGYQKGTGPQIELEKMKMENERWLAEQGWKHEEWRDKVNFEREKEAKRLMFDREAETNRWNTIMTIGTKWMDKASPIIDAGINATQKRIMRPPARAKQLPCSDCGTMITIVGNPESVSCPQCGLVHKRQVLK